MRYDYDSETLRLMAAMVELVCLRGNVVQGTGTVGGTKGSLIKQHLHYRFKAGEETTKQLLNWLALCYDHQRAVVDTVNIGYKRPVRVDGALATDKRWTGQGSARGIRQRIAYDALNQAKAETAFGVGACWVRPTWGPGELPGLACIPGSHVSAWGTTTNPADPVVVFEYRGVRGFEAYASAMQYDHLWAWDISNPRAPRFGAYRDRRAFEDRNPYRPSYSEPPMVLEGDAYPFRDEDGTPTIPGGFYQGRPDPSCILPVSGLAMPTLWAIIAYTWAEHPAVIRGWPLPVPWSTKDEPKGLDQMVGKPASVVPMWGEGFSGVDLIPSATLDTKERRQFVAEAVGTMLERYDRRLAVDATKEAKSGLALMIEASQEQGLFDEQRARFEPVDAQVLQSYVSMWNESVEYGWIDEQPLPEEDIRVTLQRSFSSDAEARNYTRKAEMYDKRLSSAPRLLCAERGLDETPENIAESEARLTAILDERARFGDDERQEATAQAKAPEQTRGAV